MSLTTEQELAALRKQVVVVMAQQAAMAAGLRGAVLEDVGELAAKSFRFDPEKGKLFRCSEHGDRVGEGQVATVEHWLEGQKTTRPHWFREVAPGGNSDDASNRYSSDPTEYRKQREAEMQATRDGGSKTDALTSETSQHAREISSIFGSGGSNQGGGTQQSRYSDDPAEYQRQRETELAAARK